MWRYVHSDELYHWKYVHKEKVDGKWRYYYEIDKHKEDIKNNIRDAMGYDEKALLEVTKKGHDEYAQKKLDAEKKFDEAYNASKNGQPSDYNTLLIDKNRMRDSFNEYKRADGIYQQRKKSYEEALRKYENTPLSKLEKAVEKGKALFSKLFGKR